DFHTRGRALDHTLAVCRTLWRETSASFADDELTFAHIHQMPKPVQPGGVPIWVSGTVNDAVVQRLAGFGTGWSPPGGDAANLAESIPRVRDRLRALGRDPSDLRVVGTLPRDGVDRLPSLVEQGVTDFRAHVPLASLPDVVASFGHAVGRA